MSVVISVSTGASGGGAANARYVSCGVAVVEEHEGFTSWGLPDYVTEPENWTDLRAELISWAGMRQDMEIARHGNRPGEPRTHFRAILSFERDVPTDRALGLARQWIDTVAPESVGFATLHRDTDHPHVHVWIDARQQDGYKIQWAPQEYQRLDEAWSKIYSVEMAYLDTVENGAPLNNRTVERRHKEHLAKKQETLEHKVALAQWHRAPKWARETFSRPVGPERADRRPTRNEGASRLERTFRDPLLPPRRNLTDREARMRWQTVWNRREVQRIREELRASAAKRRKQEEERQRMEREQQRKEYERQQAEREERRREEQKRAEQREQEAQRFAQSVLQFTESVAEWMESEYLEDRDEVPLHRYKGVWPWINQSGGLSARDRRAYDVLDESAKAVWHRHWELDVGQQLSVAEYLRERQPHTPSSFTSLDAPHGVPGIGMQLVGWIGTNSRQLVRHRTDEQRRAYLERDRRKQEQMLAELDRRSEERALEQAERERQNELAGRLITDSLQFREAVAAWLDPERAEETSLHERIGALQCTSEEALASDSSSSDELVLSAVASALYEQYETLGDEQQERVEGQLLQEGPDALSLDMLPTAREAASPPPPTGMELVRWIGERSEQITAGRADALREAELKRQQRERKRQRVERRKRREAFERDSRRKTQANDFCQDVAQFLGAVKRWLNKKHFEEKNLEDYIGHLRTIRNPGYEFAFYSDEPILRGTAEALLAKYNQLDALQQEHVDGRLAQQELSMDSVERVKQRCHELAQTRSQIEEKQRYRSWYGPDRGPEL